MLLQRTEALKLLAGALPEDPMVVTCGATSREMVAVARRRNHLYVVDSMGLVPSITLGLALGLAESPFRKVVGIEGDGGMLMNLNSLASIGYLRPRKLLLVVLDNQAYASTGGQPTFTDRLELCEVAQACGLRTWPCHNAEGFLMALAEATLADGPCFVRLKVSPENARVPYLIEDPAVLRHTFQVFLQERQAFS
ncbi:MAG: phosphonopyruvate decarboxylase [Chloroflexi bacterium]|nr:phosphonopyruvate decarboxylase [Chloroflexota bacterium]